MMAYPEHITGVKKGMTEGLHCNEFGNEIIYDDGVAKVLVKKFIMEIFRIC